MGAIVSPNQILLMFVWLIRYPLTLVVGRSGKGHCNFCLRFGIAVEGPSVGLKMTEVTGLVSSVSGLGFRALASLFWAQFQISGSGLIGLGMWHAVSPAPRS